MIYEYIKTAFGVLIGILNSNTLLTIALVSLGLYCLWVTLSLVFSFERKFERNAKKIYKEVYGKGINNSNFYKVNDLINKMPSAFIRGWNTFRYKMKGLPSEYIKREDSLDLELSGGVFNRNRSLMRTLINSVFIFLLLSSVAMLGNEEALTGFAIAQSTLIPLLFLALAKTTYYIYTAIRQFQYRVAVDSFNELLSVMDTAVVSGQENSGKTNYKEEVKDQEQEKEEKVDVVEERASEEIVKVEEQKNEEKPQQNIEKTDDKPAKKRGRPKLEFASGEPIVIRTDSEFEIALERAEKLMRKSEQQLSPAQSKRVEKNLKELIDAMNKYREEDE